MFGRDTENKPFAESYVEINYNGDKYQGKGVAPNILHSTLNAMVNAFDAIYRLK